MQRLDIYQDQGGDTLAVGPNISAGQRFVSHHDNLTGIRFSVSNPRLGGSQEYKFDILDDKQEVLRSTVATESNLGWQSSFRYDFSPIPDSSGKTYILLLSYLEKPADQKSINLENPKVAKDHLLQVSYTNQDSYKEGTALMNNMPVAGDLTFSTFYKVTASTFLKDSISEFRGKLFQDKPFLFSYLLILIVLLSYLIYRISNKKSA